MDSPGIPGIPPELDACRCGKVETGAQSKCRRCEGVLEAIGRVIGRVCLEIGSSYHWFFKMAQMLHTVLPWGQLIPGSMSVALTVRFQSVLFFYMSNCRVKNAALGRELRLTTVKHGG